MASEDKKTNRYASPAVLQAAEILLSLASSDSTQMSIMSAKLGPWNMLRLRLRMMLGMRV